MVALKIKSQEMKDQEHINLKDNDDIIMFEELEKEEKG